MVSECSPRANVQYSAAEAAALMRPHVTQNVRMPLPTCQARPALCSLLRFRPLWICCRKDAWLIMSMLRGSSARALHVSYGSQLRPAVLRHRVMLESLRDISSQSCHCRLHHELRLTAACNKLHRAIGSRWMQVHGAACRPRAFSMQLGQCKLHQVCRRTPTGRL